FLLRLHAHGCRLLLPDLTTRIHLFYLSRPPDAHRGGAAPHTNLKALPGTGLLAARTFAPSFASVHGNPCTFWKTVDYTPLIPSALAGAGGLFLRSQHHDHLAAFQLGH